MTGDMFSPSACCGNVVKLQDLVGKPVEFRQFKQYAPQIGVKWTCPTCGAEYFAKWIRIDRFWDDVQDALKHSFISPHGECVNDNFGKFIVKDDGQVKDSGAFLIVLELYETFEISPRKVCESEENTQIIQFTFPYEY